MKTCSTRPLSTYLVEKITWDKASHLGKKEEVRVKSLSHDATIYHHNVATIRSALVDELGPHEDQAGSSKARALSHAPALPHSEHVPALPVSPYLEQQTKVLSDSLVGTDTELEDTSGDRGLKVGKLIQGIKVKMGWYKVSRSSFDYAPASIDQVLVDRGVKEPEERKIPTSTLIRLEKDARTMSLIGSFSDMLGASSRKLIDETLEDESLPQRVEMRSSVLRTSRPPEALRPTIPCLWHQH